MTQWAAVWLRQDDESIANKISLLVLQSGMMYKVVCSMKTSMNG